MRSDTTCLVMNVSAPTQSNTDERHRGRPERTRIAYIRWKLCTGRLPNVNVLEIYAGSGGGGYCDACDELLAPPQFVIAIPWSSEKTFTHLHASCSTCSGTTSYAWRACGRYRALPRPLQRLPRRPLRRMPRRRLPRGSRRARRRVFHPARVERRTPAALVVLVSWPLNCRRLQEG